jgi:hypothetical protein
MLDRHAAVVLLMQELMRVNRRRREAGVGVAFPTPTESLAAVQAEYELLVRVVRDGADDTEVVAAALRLAAVALKAGGDLGRPEQRDAIGAVSDRLAAQGKGYAVSPRRASKEARPLRPTSTERGRVRVFNSQVATRRNAQDQRARTLALVAQATVTSGQTGIARSRRPRWRVGGTGVRSD